MTVAMTIFEQLGGSRFRAMTGARDLMSSGPALLMRLPGNLCRDGINGAAIRLDASDTYTVTFTKTRGTKYRIVAEHEGVYAENLRTLFESATGLRVSL